MHAISPHTVLYAILGFSLGVEAGNQIVLLPLYGMLQSVKKFQTKTLRPEGITTVQQLGSGVIAVAGVYYLCVALATNI